MLKGQLRVLVFFGTIFGFIGFSVGYLLFFTPGLSFEQVGIGESAKVFLDNNSVHPIRDINVMTKDGKIFMQLKELKAGEKVEIELESLENVSEIIAVAPYHAQASKFLENLSTERGIRYELSYPPIAFKEVEFAAIVTLCSAESKEAVVEESHDKKFFSQNFENRAVSIPEGKCANAEFKFTPISDGKTEILFNIKSSNFNQAISKEIDVRE